MFLAIVVIQFVAALFSVCIYFHFQEAFILRPQHGQKVVGRNFGYGLREVEVAAVLGGLRIGLALLGYLGAHAARAVNAAQRFPVVGRFADALCQNVPGALQSFLHISHLPFYVFGGIGLGVAALVIPKQICQRLQALRDGHRGARLALRPIRQVQVFQLTAADAAFYGFFQLRGKFSLLLNGAQDGCLALFHFFEDIGPMLYFPYLYVCEAASALFSIAADEGDGAAFLEQIHAVFHLPVLDVQETCNMLNI